MSAQMIEQDLQIAAARRLERIAQENYAQMIALSNDGDDAAEKPQASVLRRMTALLTANRGFRWMTSDPATR